MTKVQDLMPHNMTISEDKALITIPENITYEQAAANTEGAHYAYNFIKKVNIESGQKTGNVVITVSGQTETSDNKN